MYCWAQILPWNLNKELDSDAGSLKPGSPISVSLFRWLLGVLGLKALTCWHLLRQQRGVTQEARGQGSTFTLELADSVQNVTDAKQTNKTGATKSNKLTNDKRL